MNDWRNDAKADYDRAVERGEQAEEVLRELPHEVRDHVEIRYGWAPPALDDCEIDGDLPDFHKRTARMERWVGRPPDEVSTEGWLDRTSPSLRAVWKFPEAEILVRTVCPSDCALEETEEYVKVKKLNSRCADAVAAIGVGGGGA